MSRASLASTPAQLAHHLRQVVPSSEQRLLLPTRAQAVQTAPGLRCWSFPSQRTPTPHPNCTTPQANNKAVARSRL